MPGWAWLPASLVEKPGVFGNFNKCLAFESFIQHESISLDDSPKPSSTLPEARSLSTEQDVGRYLDRLDMTQPDVSILAFTKLTRETNGELPLPISRQLFERVIEAFNIPTTFLSLLNTGLATYTSTFHVDRIANVEKQTSAKFIFQQNRAYSAFSIAASINFETGKTRALIFGVEPSSLSELYAHLGSLSRLAHGPMMIPAVAMELQAQAFTMTIKDCHDRIHSIETATGMRQCNYTHEKADLNAQDWKNSDLISITRDLSSFLSRFAFLKMQAETGRSLVNQMVQTTQSLMEMIRRGQIECEIEDQIEVSFKLEHLRSWYEGIAARCQYLSERTAAQSQTVYCLIASRDNSTNIEIARASHDIAELTRQDNKLMIHVARSSQEVALATAQDSSAMQVIAAVTILFLPATFTATFFSMAFFDFSDDENPRISSLSWIYVLVTAILTAVIQLSWATVSKAKRAKIIEKTNLEQRCC